MTERSVYRLSAEERGQRLKSSRGPYQRRKQLERVAAEMRNKYLTPARKAQQARREIELRERASGGGD